VKTLLRLYPAWWRDRYGAEMAALLDDLPHRARVRTALDLIKGALDARFALAKETAMSRSLRTSVLLALAVWVALSIDVVLTNVVFPSREDNDGPTVLLAYLGIFAILGTVGFLAGRSGVQLRGAALCGAVAGAVIGFLTIGTFLVVDNVWLDIVSQQQTKIQALANAGGGSMRAYINGSLVPGLFVMPLILGGFGAVLAMGGASLSSVSVRRRGPA
jgi:hypothetical protein